MRPRPDYGETSYVGRGRLPGKIALITGGDSGIGRAVALAFAREGADVAIAYLNEHEDAHETERVVEAAGRRGIAMAGDLADEATARRGATGRWRRSGASTSWSTTPRTRGRPSSGSRSSSRRAWCTPCSPTSRRRSS